MKILILTEGGRNIGFGHLSRCVALIQGISRFNIKNKTKAKFVINRDETAITFLRRQKIASIIMSDWIKRTNKLIDLIKASDVVIVDSYLAPEALYDFIYKVLVDSPAKQFINRLICIDDYNRVDYPPSIILNPSIYGDMLNYGIQPKSNQFSVYLKGIDYGILRREFWHVPNKYIRKTVKDILVTFGGINHANFTKRLVRFISTKYPQFKYHFISPGSNFSARDMLRLMLKCDICISAGGQTTYELARIGLPAIGICFAENQRLNLEAWKRNGFIEYIGWHNDARIFSKLDCAIRNLLPYRERSICSQIGRNIINGKIIRKAYQALVRKICES